VEARVGEGKAKMMGADMATGTAMVMETITATEEGTATTSRLLMAEAPKLNPPTDFPAQNPLK